MPSQAMEMNGDTQQCPAKRRHSEGRARRGVAEEGQGEAEEVQGDMMLSDAMMRRK